MAFFGFGKKEEKQEKKVTPKVTPKKSVTKKAPKSEPEKKTSPKISKSKPKKTPTPSKKRKTDYSSVLIKPRITEKAAVIAEESNVYTFNVHPSSTKKEVAKAVEEAYKVRPVKVNVTQIKRKTVLRRGKKGKTAGGKKAMVYLKSGDKIEFV